MVMKARLLSIRLKARIQRNTWRLQQPSVGIQGVGRHDHKEVERRPVRVAHCLGVHSVGENWLLGHSERPQKKAEIEKEL